MKHLSTEVISLSNYEDGNEVFPSKVIRKKRRSNEEHPGEPIPPPGAIKCDSQCNQSRTKCDFPSERLDDMEEGKSWPQGMPIVSGPPESVRKLGRQAPTAVSNAPLHQAGNFAGT